MLRSFCGIGIAAVLIAACSSSSDGGSSPSDTGGTPSGKDAGASSSGQDAGGSTADAATGSGGDTDAGGGGGGGDVDAGPIGTCPAGATCGAIVGNVVRTATKPTHGGKGPVYIAVFDGNPILDKANAKLVGRTLLQNADLSADGAKVAYRIDAIPTRAAEYQVIAFLDDDDNAGTTAAPAKGDLVSMLIGGGGIGGIPATVSSAADVPLDLPLNTAMP